MSKKSCGIPTSGKASNPNKDKAFTPAMGGQPKGKTPKQKGKW